MDVRKLCFIIRCLCHENAPGPGNFLEVVKMLPLLLDGTSAEAPSFHVVAPSLPGFAFSEGTTKKGFATAQYAEV
jgi:hypothetical protein